MESGGGGGGGGGGREAPSRPLTAEEEALKRNTDCVYFLASPLTCKKGNECEYRHSEVARVNPRDCWYWLNGNCLNPKCSFRHPPLDSLFGIPGTTSVPAPPSQIVSTTQIPAVHPPASHNPNKQGVPCYYFQKGLCLKGDRCAFMHGPQPAGIPVPLQVAKVSASVTEPPKALKESWGMKECTSQQSIPRGSANKPVEVLPASAKPTTHAETLPYNGLPLKRSPSPYPMENELQRSHPTNVPVSSGNAVGMPRTHQSQLVDERLPNGRDADEFLGESSPGFDVLVDDDIQDSEYLQNEDEFGRELAQGGRNLYPVTDFNYHHSDYEPIACIEGDRYNGADEYDRYGRGRNRYGREQERSSSERILDRPLVSERRVLQREESPEEVDGSDLRHRLLKQRRLNGSRLTVSPDRRREPYRRDDRYIEEERYRGRRSHRDRQHFPRESSISTRLQGRITLPVKISPDRPVDLRSLRERDRGRHRGRLSPPRPINYQGRQLDRIKRRAEEDLTADAKNVRGQPVRRDAADSLNFAGPKSLAELKSAKVSEIPQEHSTKTIHPSLSPDRKNMKLGKAVGCQESEVSLSFEGPKPLSNILKRKRETGPEDGAASCNGSENNYRDEVIVGDSASAAVSDLQLVSSSEAGKEGTQAVSSLEEPKVRSLLVEEEEEEEEEEEGLIPSAGEYDQSSAKDAAEIEEGMITDTPGDQELEISYERNEESDCEAVEGGDIKAEDDENMYRDGDEELDDDDDDDDDDEDDFARKVGVMFS